MPKAQQHLQRCGLASAINWRHYTCALYLAAAQMIFLRMDAHHSRVHTVLLVGPECGTIVSALGQGMDASAGSTETSLWTHYKAGEREYCGNAFPDGLKKNDRSVSANQPATVSRQTRLNSSHRYTQDCQQVRVPWHEAAFYIWPEILEKRSMFNLGRSRMHSKYIGRWQTRTARLASAPCKFAKALVLQAEGERGNANDQGG